MLKVEDCKEEPNSLTITLLNTRAWNKHCLDVIHDQIIMNSDIIFLTETQVETSCQVQDKDNENNMFYDISHNINATDKFSSLATCLPKASNAKFNDVLILPGASLICVKKETYNLNLSLIHI